MVFKKGHKSFFGKKHTEETKRKIGLSRKKYIGEKASNWKGGRILIDGYLYIYNPKHPYSTKDGYVCEHRLIMEKKIKRFLLPHEVIHHKNHNKVDNRIENLELLESTGKHCAKYHMKKDRKGRFKCH